MKKIYNIIGVALICVAGTSCTGKYLEINTNPYEATDEQVAADDYVIRGALKNMLGYVVPVQEHQFQFMDVLCGSTLGGYLAEQKGWETKISTYNATDDWTADPFEKVIPGFYGAYNQLRNFTSDPVTLAVAEIARVSVFAQLADIYGPVPFTHIGADGSLVAPYDSQEDVYDTGFKLLTEAVETLTARSSETINSSADIIFKGNLTNWVKYANTLKLRMAMRIVYADPEKAQKMAEEAVNHSIGTMATNSDNAVFTHSVQNLYVLLCTNWGDYRAAADIVSYMNGYSDPRREAYFTVSGYPAKTYAGWRRGTRMGDSTSGANCSNMKVETDDPMMWMNAAEAMFLKAEGALRGWNMGGEAKDFYEAGIRLSFAQWNVNGADKYIADAVSVPEDYVDQSGKGYDASYSSRATIAWNNSGDFETNLEKIITQKWIANWRATGVEAWAEFRRTGYPRLFTAGVNLSGGVIAEDGYARRSKYPVSELTSNSENYSYAVTNFLKGSDNMATRTWWDCNPRITK